MRGELFPVEFGLPLEGSPLPVLCSPAVELDIVDYILEFSLCTPDQHVFGLSTLASCDETPPTATPSSTPSGVWMMKVYVSVQEFGRKANWVNIVANSIGPIHLPFVEHIFVFVPLVLPTF